MFDVSVFELLIIGIVALVVLGPERLPKAARLAGFWVRKARAQWYSVKAELESEIADEELKNSLKESMASMQETLSAHQASLQNEMHAIEHDLDSTKNELNDEINETLVDHDPASPDTTDTRA